MAKCIRDYTVINSQPSIEALENLITEIFWAYGLCNSAEDIFYYGNEFKIKIDAVKAAYDSLSDDQNKKGRPRNFRITVRDMKPSIGAGFLVCLTGDIMTMPGLPKHPAALDMDVLEDGKAVGLF